MANSRDKCKPEESALQNYLADLESKFGYIKERAMIIKEGGQGSFDEIGMEVKRSLTVIRESTSKNMIGIKDDFKTAFDEAKVKMSDSWEITKVELGKISTVVKKKSVELFEEQKK